MKQHIFLSSGYFPVPQNNKQATFQISDADRSRLGKMWKYKISTISYQWSPDSESRSTSQIWKVAHCFLALALKWRHNGRESVSNHQPHDCLLSHLLRRRSQKTSKLRVTGLCAENSPVTDEFPAQMASNAVNVSIWWRHHGPWPLHTNMWYI